MEKVITQKDDLVAELKKEIREVIDQTRRKEELISKRKSESEASTKDFEMKMATKIAKLEVILTNY
jgi:hypothetical protein